MKCAYRVLVLALVLGPATCLIIKSYIIVWRKASWGTAQDYCRTYYTDLVSFQTETEFGNFLEIMSTYLVSQSWIGLYKAPRELEFTEWSDGSPVNYTYWEPGKLSNSTAGLCGSILTTTEWSSDNCSEPLSFFCYEWDPSIVVVNELKTWEEALGHCREIYSDLVSLTTKTDFTAVRRSLKNQTASVWTGLRFMDGLWFWTNNKSLGGLVQLPSCPAQPYHCGALVHGTWALETRDCMEKSYFVCYVYE